MGIYVLVGILYVLWLRSGKLDLFNVLNTHSMGAYMYLIPPDVYIYYILGYLLSKSCTEILAVVIIWLVGFVPV